MIKTHNLTFSYSGQQNFRFPDIFCANGDALLITGNSGVGKTTFLHLLGGLLKPASGKILINQQDISLLKARHLDLFRGTHIGMVLQRSFFIESLTVLDNVLLASRTAENHRKPEIMRMFEKLGLKDHRHKLPRELSAGQQQRVGIARALINSPAVILADEPTSSLDDENAFTVAGLLSTLAREAGSSLLIVTHDQRLKSEFKQHISLS